ncbi:MAG: hypothetical protein QW424_05085 [Candidatus Bathyarchaeia archaeon]
MIEVNLLLPLSLFVVIALSISSYRKVGKRLKEAFGDKKISIREAIIMVIFMGILVVVISLIPDYAIQILFIAALSYSLFIFTYLFLRRILISVIPPMIFTITFLLLNYFLMDNILAVILITNIFSATFAIIITTLIGPLFSWRVIIAFAALLTAMDIIHVFITGYMVEAAGRAIRLGLPLMFLLPRLPSMRGVMVLGLGDVFLSGLFSIQMTSKYSPRAGLLTAALISMVFLVFDIIVSNFIQYAGAFPATLLVLLGWFLGMIPHILKRKEKKVA